jgi:hypothetical protein
LVFSHNPVSTPSKVVAREGRSLSKPSGSYNPL